MKRHIKKFVGYVQHPKTYGLYDFTDRTFEKHPSLQSAAKQVAFQFGSAFEQSITYRSPDWSKFLILSKEEKEEFDKAVRKNLEALVQS